MVVSSTVVEDIIVGGLNKKNSTIEKMSWLRYFYSMGLLKFKYRKSHTSNPPLFVNPLPAENK